VQYFESLCYRIVVWTSANFASESERTGEYTDVLPSDYGYKKVFGNYSPTILGHGGTGKFKLERCLTCRGYPVNVYDFKFALHFFDALLLFPCTCSRTQMVRASIHSVQIAALCLIFVSDTIGRRLPEQTRALARYLFDVESLNRELQPVVGAKYPSECDQPFTIQLTRKNSCTCVKFRAIMMSY